MLLKRTDRPVYDLPLRFDHGIQVAHRIPGELDFVFISFLCDPGNIGGIIPYALEIADHPEIFRHLARLLGIHFLFREDDQVIPYLRFVLVDQILLTHYFFVPLIGEIKDQVQGAADIFPHFFGHTDNHAVSLSDCQCGRYEQTLLKQVKICIVRQVLQVFHAVLDERSDQLLNLRNERKQDADSHNTENGVDRGDHHRIHRHVHK